jgi:hypothetical protein
MGWQASYHAPDGKKRGMLSSLQLDYESDDSYAVSLNYDCTGCPQKAVYLE